MHDCALDKEINPKVSILLLSFNQELFISEALESIINQNYSPLQIIVSDDKSTDGTVDLIEKTIAKYSGPHEIIFNKNIVNMGISEHLNHILKMAQGEFIFLAAGDDISYPNRVKEIIYYWNQSGRKESAIFSNLERIDSSGLSYGLQFNRRPHFADSLAAFKAGSACWSIGASFAFRREVFFNFLPLPPNVLQEDGCFAFRALLLGNIGYIDKPLVKYRFHENSISQHGSARKRVTLKRQEYFMHLSNYNDALLLKDRDRDLIRVLKRKVFLSYISRLYCAIPFIPVAFAKFRMYISFLKRKVVK